MVVEKSTIKINLKRKQYLIWSKRGCSALAIATDHSRDSLASVCTFPSFYLSSSCPLLALCSLLASKTYLDETIMKITSRPSESHLDKETPIHAYYYL